MPRFEASATPHGVMNSPRPRSLNSFSRSRMSTCLPCSAIALASAEPPKPPPTVMMSYSEELMFSPCSEIMIFSLKVNLLLFFPPTSRTMSVMFPPCRTFNQTMKKLGFFVLLLGFCIGSSCDSGNATRNTGVPKYSYEVVHVYPHDSEAFTQGLIFLDGKLLESTGQEGRSTLRTVDLDSGQVVKKVDVPAKYFAEGMTVLNGKIYQLTWQHQIGFI